MAELEAVRRWESLVESSEALAGLVERTIRASSLQIERLRERAPLSPEEKSARAQVLRVVLVSQRQSIAAGTSGGGLLRDRGHDHVAAPRLLETPGHRFG